MTTFLPQNQFNSASSSDVDEAGASTPAPSRDAPATLSVSGVLSSTSTSDSNTEASGTEAAGSVRTAASDICDVGEIFRVANLLCETRQFVPDYPSLYQAMLDPIAPRLRADDPVWADEAPLFLKSIG